MALIIGGLIAAGAGIGALVTYAGTKIFADSPSTAHVQTIVSNQIAAHVDADNNHEVFQNNIITILLGAAAFAFALSVLRFAVIGIRAARRNKNNNNNKNTEMHAINIDA